MQENEVKNAVENIGYAFEEFKKANDERLDAIEKGKSYDGLLDEKIAKIEEKMDAFEDVNQKITQATLGQENIKEQISNLETALKRPNAGLDTKQIDESLVAFDSYCRKGFDALSDVEKKALTVSNDSTGGYLAPPEYVRELLKTVTEISPIRQIARIRSTAQRSIQIPKRVGQFSAQWVAESGTRSETTGYQVGLEEIPAHEYYAMVDISEQDLEDSVFDLEAFMTNSSVSSVNSGAASALTGDGLISLVHSIKSEYSSNASFVFNRSTLAEIRKLKDTAGQYVFQAGMMLTSGVPNSILGFPYIQATDMPSVAANAFPVAFGDFNRGYMIVDRIAMAVLRDPFTQATSGNIRYVARRRVGGQVIQAEAIVKQKVAS